MVAPSRGHIHIIMGACDLSGIGLKIKMVWGSIPITGHVWKCWENFLFYNIASAYSAVMGIWWTRIVTGSNPLHTGMACELYSPKGDESAPGVRLILGQVTCWFNMVYISDLKLYMYLYLEMS